VTPEALATLHGRCFTVPRTYTAAEFAGFLASDTCFLCSAAAGFALGRSVADEAEILTIAVDPDHRRAGVGRGLLTAFEAQAKARGAVFIFLEVAAGNDAAIALYQAARYRESGRRPGYYRYPNGHREDAVMMEKSLSSS